MRALRGALALLVNLRSKGGGPIAVGRESAFELGDWTYAPAAAPTSRVCFVTFGVSFLSGASAPSPGLAHSTEGNYSAPRVL